MTEVAAAAQDRAPRRPRGTRKHRGPVLVSTLDRVSGTGLGIALIWFSLLVLLPLTAVLVKAAEGGWGAYWAALRDPQTAAAIGLTVVVALIITAINVVIGTLVAWVLVRDDFPGKRILEIVIDLPFALPTIVAGLVLLSLYGPQSPLGLNWANTRMAVALAFLFVTLPFVVRTVQPVLLEMEPEAEEAAASLGAGPLTVFRRIVLPSLVPAVTSGAAMSFARALSEFGSLVLLSGNLPMHTEVAAVRILGYIEGDNLHSAAAVASVLLLVALVAIVLLDVFSRRVTHHDD
ncbi:sulfate ABC transporter permease subunit CysT [Raineyella sp. LH-20]|uniref:sulfate ABC transporter permease subunit CysT n=1 Tax=Raineyella sp. LH-20 TaxID=3081204 RepID=UPI0029552F78|nr:sulfate ABC transporter permease subunit CysT [Raineyella sp. LH-20]WOP17783.1 sulfate ABC transporter permease subunit CysT [Raineyella sp. LH-20]